jgi:hypothetical protein
MGHDHHHNRDDKYPPDHHKQDDQPAERRRRVVIAETHGRHGDHREPEGVAEVLEVYRGAGMRAEQRALAELDGVREQDYAGEEEE